MSIGSNGAHNHMESARHIVQNCAYGNAAMYEEYNAIAPGASITREDQPG